MFIIVPKRVRRADGTATDASQKLQQDNSAEDDTRGPVRTQSACDGCRLRKSKCNGRQPCGRCHEKRIICVYSRAMKRDMPTSPAQVALLQHQQRRLTTAVQRMASVIAKYESGTEKAPELFNVLDLLELYAPHGAPDAFDFVPSSNTGSESQKRALNGLELENESNKRACVGAEPGQPSLMSRFPKERTALQNCADRSLDIRGSTQSNDEEMPYTLEPNPAFNNLDHSADQYEAMLQIMQSMNNNASVPGTMPSAVAPQNTSCPASLQIESDQTARTQSTGRSPTTVALDESTKNWMNLVDWEASLAHFSDFVLDPQWSPPNFSQLDVLSDAHSAT